MHSKTCIIISIFLRTLDTYFSVTGKMSRLQIWYGSHMVSTEMLVPCSFLFYYPCIMLFTPRTFTIMAVSGKKKGEDKRPKVPCKEIAWKPAAGIPRLLWPDQCHIATPQAKKVGACSFLLIWAHCYPN